MYSYDKCWVYQCQNPDCARVVVLNNVVLEHRHSEGVVQCSKCSQRMEQVREALPGEYDPDSQEESARWTTAFKVTFVPPWDVDRYLYQDVQGLNYLSFTSGTPDNTRHLSTLTHFTGDPASVQLEEPSFITEEDAGHIFGISARAVQQLVKRGKLRSIKLTKRRQVFTRAMIDEFLQGETGSNKMTQDGLYPDRRCLSPRKMPISLEESRSLLKDLREDMSPPDADERPIHISRRR